MPQSKQACSVAASTHRVTDAHDGCRLLVTNPARSTTGADHAVPSQSRD
jgi:hypothetical protein